jgi:oligogalacturonide lyase
MAAVWSRRAFLCSPPLLLSAQQQVLKYHDPATEFDVVRLTDPKITSLLPPPHLLSVGGRNNSLLFCSNQSGTMQPYRVDLKSGEITAAGKATALVPDSLSLLPGDRAICFFDGPRLLSLLNGRRHENTRTVYEVPEPWEKAPGFGLSVEGNHAAFIERNGNAYRIRLASMLRGGVSTVLQADTPLSDVMPRPRRAGLIYRKEAGLWLVNFDGQQNRPLKTAPGKIGSYLWSADGKTVLYLSYPDDPAKLHQVRELTPDTNEDKLVAPTSQFVAFARNADATVFAGASASKASRYILLLLRTARRELTLCEHRASDATQVVIAFAPNSQRLFFQSDRDGKPAIYTMKIEKFVEETES